MLLYCLSYKSSSRVLCSITTNNCENTYGIWSTQGIGSIATNVKHITYSVCRNWTAISKFYEVPKKWTCTSNIKYFMYAFKSLAHLSFPTTSNTMFQRLRINGKCRGDRGDMTVSGMCLGLEQYGGGIRYRGGEALFSHAHFDHKHKRFQQTKSNNKWLMLWFRWCQSMYVSWMKMGLCLLQHV